MVTLAEFEAGAKDSIFALVRNSRWRWLNCRNLYVGVYTTTGQMILARMDPTIRDFILERIRQEKPQTPKPHTP